MREVDGYPALAPLAGLRVLLLEDEAMVSLLVEDMLRELGCDAVAHASSIGRALALIELRQPDLAVLDVNLGGEMAFPVAERLEKLGVPFIFATGYGRKGIPGIWAAQPVIQKPFAKATLAAALGSAMDGGSGGAGS